LKTSNWTAVWVLLAGLSGAVSAFAAAPQWDLKDVEGKTHRLADYKGRWVMLNFWATWCVPCIQEIPEIAAWSHSHPGVVVLGVALDAEDVAKTRRFAVKAGHDYPLVLSDDSVEAQLGSVRALPTTRIFDPAGKIVYDKPGRVDAKLLDSVIKPPAARPTPTALSTP
jgi:thiol-disulfide isomerase/thioredoxin